MEKKNFDCLTGLKFLPCFLLFLYFNHDIFNFSPYFVSIYEKGLYSVSGLFVLSGFLITYHYYQSFTELNVSKLWEFWLARLSKIVPLYFTLIFTMWYVYKANFHLKNYLLGVSGWQVNQISTVNSSSWFISVILFLYIIFPFFVFINFQISKRVKLKGEKIIFLMLILIFYFCNIAIIPHFFANIFLNYSGKQNWLYFFPVCRIDEFLMGFFIAKIYLTSSAIVVPKFFRYSSLAILFLVVLLLLPEINGISFYYNDLLFPVAYAWLILTLINNPTCWSAKILSKDISICLGKSSFAFSLVFLFIGSFFYNPHLSFFYKLFSYALNLFFVICFSYGLYKTIEVPGQYYLKKCLALSKIKFYYKALLEILISKDTLKPEPEL